MSLQSYLERRLSHVLISGNDYFKLTTAVEVRFFLGYREGYLRFQ
jgi:hypothetical protein